MTTQINSFDLAKKKIRAETVVCDQLSVGGEWKSWTPTLTNAVLHASDTQSWKYKVVGKTLFIRGFYNHTANAGSSSGGAYSMTLPPGCTAITPTVSQACGSAMLSGNAFQTVGVVYAGASVFQIYISTGAGTAASWGHGTHADVRFSAATAAQISCEATIELDSTSAVLAKLTV